MKKELFTKKKGFDHTEKRFETIEANLSLQINS